jgi:hypothetical protein
MLRDRLPKGPTTPAYQPTSVEHLCGVPSLDRSHHHSSSRIVADCWSGLLSLDHAAHRRGVLPAFEGCRQSQDDHATAGISRGQNRSCRLRFLRRILSGHISMTSPYRCEGPTPLFPTQNELLHFVKDSVSTGLLRRCAHLAPTVIDPRRTTAQRGYTVACARDSFKTVEWDRTGVHDFFGCPADCLLFTEDRRRDVPWRSVPPATVAQDHQPKRRRHVRGPWILAAATVLAALIGVIGAWWANRSGSDIPRASIQVPQNSPGSNQQTNSVQQSPGAKSVQSSETQQTQSVRSSPGSSNIQAGRDVNIIQQPPRSPVGWDFSAERVKAFRQALQPGSGREITISNNVADGDGEVLAGRLASLLAEKGWVVKREQFLSGASSDGLKILGTSGLAASALAAALKAAGYAEVTTSVERAGDRESLKLVVGIRW